MIVLIPNELPSQRLYTAFEATKIHKVMTSRDSDVLLIDANLNKELNFCNEDIVVPIEWLSTLCNSNFIDYIRNIKKNNNVYFSGHIANRFHDYIGRLFEGCEFRFFDKEHFICFDPVFLKNSELYAYAPIESSWGCNGKCSFCLSRTLSDNFDWYEYPITELLGYISRVVGDYKYKYFYFLDNNFIANEDHAYKVSEAILEAGFKIKYDIEARVDSITESVLSHMKMSGLRRVLLGIESGSDSALKRYNKNTSVKQNISTIELLRKHSINIDPSFIMFDPEISYAEIGDNLRFIRDFSLYNSRMSGSLLNKMIVFDSDNPHDCLNYHLKDGKAGLFEARLREEKINHIRSKEAFDFVYKTYLEV